MKPTDRCYVCDDPPIGHVRGMPACAACRKFITRHRHISLSSLRCEVGGPLANKCDMRQKRTCTKCRLRRSIELNPTLRHYIESRVPNATQEVADVVEHQNHLNAMGRLRKFLSKKQTSTDFCDDRSTDGNFTVNSPGDANTTSGRISAAGSSGDDSGSLGNNLLMPFHLANDGDQSDEDEAMRMTIDDDTPSPSSSSYRETLQSSSTPSVIMSNNSQIIVEPELAPWWTVVTSAVNCIPTTYPIFVTKFVDKFKLCTLDECRQILTLAAVNEAAGNNVGFCGNNFSMTAPGNPFQPTDLLSAFSIYSTIVMAPENVPRALIIEAIRQNACFAYLAKVPLGMLVALANLPPNATKTTTPVTATASSATSATMNLA